ncbi:MAG: ribbon-helix-helix protein, CopG family [Gordonia sp. (in: high G+C Gram-positive bacteria)]|uniref:CopG family ribbon-helix-helix protein n=1 Tax=Gordonia sp. (in: high G+C Gram-positive bacteria) TaxID=84139 RepID=UPI0039E24CA6
MAMTLRIPPELDARLDAIAAAEHVSKHALVLQAIEALAQRNGRRDEILAAVDFVRSHDAELLDRLADS